MEFQPPPKGLIVDIITPLSKGSDIDGRGLGRLLDRVVPLAQALLLASPHSGEGINLGCEQRLELLEKVIAVIRSRNIPLFIWVSQNTEEKTRETLVALEAGLQKRNYSGQVTWVDTPLYYRSNRGLFNYYRELSAITMKPFILLNDPQFIQGLARPLKRLNIRTSILKKLVQIQAIQGMIFLGPIDRANNYYKASRINSDFRIYDGDETQFLSHPSMNGVAAVGANLAPEAWQKITNFSLKIAGEQNNYPDRLQQVWQIGQYLKNLKDIYDPSPAAIIKEVLWDRGIIETPTCTFEAGDLGAPKKRIKDLLANFGKGESIDI